MSLFSETLLDAQKKHLLAEVALHGYKIFHVDKTTSQEKEVD